MVIACSERRKRMSDSRPADDRAVKRALEMLREERKEDIVHKVAKVIEDLAIKYNARVVIGDVYRDRDRILERVSDNRMRHRIAQWSASKLARILKQSHYTSSLYLKVTPRRKIPSTSLSSPTPQQ